MSMEHSKELCKKVAGMLSEYLDEELPPASCAEILEHMKDCPPCVTFLESLRKSVELTQMSSTSTEELPPLPEEFRANLRKFYENFRKKSS
jgi:predicted anti-sigma-YlaC factor YlaD